DGPQPRRARIQRAARTRRTVRQGAVMKTDQELEQLMRTTFAGRAQTINRGPGWSGNPVMTGGPNPQRRWIAVLAAAAAVVAVVASVAVLRNRSDGEPAVKTPTPTISHAVTPTPSPTTNQV